MLTLTSVVHYPCVKVCTSMLLRQISYVVVVGQIFDDLSSNYLYETIVAAVILFASLAASRKD